MKKLSIVAALVAIAIAVPLSVGSSHREALNIMLDPAADNTDVYAFKARNAPEMLTIAANWIPGQVAANGPNFFRFDDRAAYYINIDNTGDGRPDIRYRYVFRTTVRDRNSNLHSRPEVSSIDDPDLIQVQHYSVVKETFKSRRLRSARVVAKSLPVAPSNVGPNTMPDYPAISRGAIRDLPGGGKVFAGQRDEPFFIDLGATFDNINLRVPPGNLGGGKDDFSGQNTNSIVMQLPEAAVTRDRRSVDSADAGNAVVGVWASTDRKRIEVTNSNFDQGRIPSIERTRRAQRGDSRRRPAFAGGVRSAQAGGSDEVQVSRLANPLVNELFPPIVKKDLYNRTTPAGDGKRLGRFLENPELARIINSEFPGLVNAPETGRDDLVLALLKGLPGLNQHRRNPPAVDTMKINLGIPPSDIPNRFGVIGGDEAGFPNGRRLIDDVVDIDVRLIAGFLKGNKAPLGDGVIQNDKAFLTEFPYLAEPTSGFDSNPSDRREPPTPPDPPDPAPFDGR